MNTSGGSLRIQASSLGSKALQCGQLYQKNSITSILPGGASTLSGLLSVRYSAPSPGFLPWANTLGGRPAAATASMQAAPAENSRRFMDQFTPCEGQRRSRTEGSCA